MKTTKISIKKWQILCLIFFVINITACGGSGSNSDDSNNNDNNTDDLIGIGFNKARGFNGSVQTIVLDADGSGSMYVGGEFNTYNNTQAGHLVRLKSDGTVDEAFVTGTGFTGSFSPFINNIVQTTDGSNDVYVSGRFTDYNGISINHIVRLNADGSIDSGFTTGVGSGGGASSIILATDGSGDIYATGSFFDSNGVFTTNLVRFNPDGSVDTEFDSGTGFTNGESAASLLATTDGSGDIYVAGNFSSYNGTSVNDLIRLDANGLIATTTEDVTKFTTGTGFAGSVNKMLLADDGSGDIYVGGNFSNYNGVSANSLIKLNADGSIDSELIIGDGLGIGGGSVQIRSLILAADGTDDLYVGGNFTSYSGKVTNRFLRINVDGTEDTAFVTGQAFDNGTGGIGPSISSIAVTSSGGVYAGGNFANYNGTAQNNLIRINTDGTVDTTFSAGIGTGFDDQVFDIAVATDNNGIYVAGSFNRYNGITANNLVRLKSDGTVDTEFVTGSGFGTSAFVSDLALTQNNTGDIYVAGSFKNYNGTSVNSIVRLNSDGTIDSEFSAGSGIIATSVFEIKITVANDDSNDLYVSGVISYNGTIVNGIVRLDADGTIDPSFDTGTGFGRGINNSATLFINDLALATDGSGDIYVTGRFNNYNGNSANSLVRLNNDGTLDTEFSAGTGFLTVGGSLASLFSLVPAIDGSGDIYLSGNFSTYNDEPARDLIRLNVDGEIDTEFNTEGAFGISSSARVRTFSPAVDGSGDIFIGGGFDSYKNVTSRSLVRLNTDGSVDSVLTAGAAGFGGGLFGTGEVSSISLATDNSGDIFIGGGFTSYQTTTVDYIVRLNADGSLN